MLRSLVVVCVAGVVVAVAAWAQDPPTASAPAGQAALAAVGPAPQTQAEREQAFSALLTDAVLDGSYSLRGQEGQPRMDRYRIARATKAEGERWMIEARVQYGGKDVPIVIAVNVRWAGDTPVICVDDLFIPGLGRFTARVMFFDGQYAGTWSGGRMGGQMWGRVERDRPAPAATQPAED